MINEHVKIVSMIKYQFMQIKVMSAFCPDHHNILVATVKKKKKKLAAVCRNESSYTFWVEI